MFKLNSFFFISTFITTTLAFGFRGFHYDGREEPQINETSRHLIKEKWILQPLDHFDVRNNQTWSMRYYENSEFYNGTGPILILLGGEWTISPGFLQAGLMYSIGNTHGAMMYYTEHRYYGKSHPVRYTGPENLQFLNVDQALADIAFFIKEKKQDLNDSNKTVIVFGGSYSGNMAAWSRMKYPHLIQGALASSAPVRAKVDFFEYYEAVSNSLEKYDKQCKFAVKEAMNSVDLLLSTNIGANLLKFSFNLCEVPDVHSLNDVGSIINSISEIFASIVQYNSIESNGKTKIANICDKMMNRKNGIPFQRLARIIRRTKCHDWNYHNLLTQYTNTSWDSRTITMRLWIYQTCTEYGYYQTSSKKHSTFGRFLPLQFFIQMCIDLYGNYYGARLLNDSVQRTNVMYGGPTPDLKNVIFTNGNVDPWHVLSILKDINEQTSAILIDGASHTADLYPDLSTDIVELKEARERVREIIGKWIVKGEKI